MTTIVYKAGMIAADTGSVVNGVRCGEVSKIARCACGDLAGACGSATFTTGFLRWFLEGEHGSPPAAREYHDSYDRGFIARCATGEKVVYEPGGLYGMIGDEFAMGSGRAHALTALDCGLSPAEAVLMAMKRDIYTWGHVEALTFDGSLK